MRFFTLLAVFAVLPLAVSAWGPSANKYICDEAVRFVWGSEAAKCMPLRDNSSLQTFCDTVYGVMGEEYEGKCRSAVAAGDEIYPYSVSSDVFNDTENHYDFSKCPVSTGTARPWVCGDGERPAYILSEKWFRAAETAPDMCQRIYDFCAGAIYYADSESSLHQIRFANNGCVEDIERSIDRAIEAGTGDWSASALCNFNNALKGLGNLNYKQRMGESASTMNRIIGNLTLRGLSLKDGPYTQTKGVVLLTNSVDLLKASEFIHYLKASGVNLIIANWSDFQRLRYNERIIMLGGHNAPEDVGKGAAAVLSRQDEDSLLVPGAAYMFVKSGDWSSGQKVVVLAGNEADDTRRAWSENKEKVLEVVK